MNNKLKLTFIVTIGCNNIEIYGNSTSVDTSVEFTSNTYQQDSLKNLSTTENSTILTYFSTVESSIGETSNLLMDFGNNVESTTLKNEDETSSTTSIEMTIDVDTTGKIIDCNDNIKNYDESDIDCGGSCNLCDNDKTCILNADCLSHNCENTICKNETICGNNIKEENEECDDGNEYDNDYCINCKNFICGDGFVNAKIEECDDGNIINEDDCSNKCNFTYKYVFISSELYTGNLGGLEGADIKCQNLAKKAKLPGKYMAWLSDATGSPQSRMTHIQIPYVLLNKTQVASNWQDLTDQKLNSAINITELGTEPSLTLFKCSDTYLTVFTNTNANGNPHNGFSCQNWKVTTNDTVCGKSNYTNGQWTTGCGGCLCDTQAHIYCFQQ